MNSIVARCVRNSLNLGKLPQLVAANLNQKSHLHTSNSLRSTQYYPIDDNLYQLTDDQKQVDYI